MTDSLDLSGRTFIVTGANAGVGLGTARALAARGGRVHLGCRSPERGNAAVAAIVAATGNRNVGFLELDLADLSSVRAAADAFLATGEPLHALINNAAVALTHGLTKDGFELAFGVNHLGHFAFTMKLLDRLTASKARIVNVTSGSHNMVRSIDFASLRQRTKSITGMREYSVSKLCNVLFTLELNRRLGAQGVEAYAPDPGMVASDAWTFVPSAIRPLLTKRMLTIDEGARTSLYCATSPEVAAARAYYYYECKPQDPSRVATPKLGERLWSQSVAWTWVPGS